MTPIRGRATPERRTNARAPAVPSSAARASPVRAWKRAAAAALAACLLLAGRAAAQESAPPPTGDSLRVGLALSGGSARGFAHVGVLRALEDLDVPVHRVAGVSMGALVGALYAVGYGPDQLEQLAAGQDWNALFSESKPVGAAWPGAGSRGVRHALSLPLRSGRPTLPTGLVAGQRITQLLTRLTWQVHPTHDFRRLPLPFATLATDLETGEPVPLVRGSLPLALRASMAIPSVFTPVRLDGRHLVDGGVSRNLPAEDVRRMGADVVVCSDVTEPLKSADSIQTFLDVLTQTISFRTVQEVERQREICDVLIRPEVEGLGSYSFGQAATWIAQGDSTARRLRDTLRALAAKAGAPPERPEASALSPGADSVVVAAVRFPGLAASRARYLRRIMGVPTGEPVSVERIDREVGQLYDARLFARVTYRLEEPPPGSPEGRLPRRTLVVEATSGGRRELRAGVRFDSHRQAAVLFTVDLPQLLGFGSAAQVDVRLGEQLHFEARQRFRPSFAPGFLLGARAGYRRTPLELPAPSGGTDLDVSAEAVDGGLLVGRFVGQEGVIGVEAGAEWFEVDAEEGTAPPEPGGWLATATALAAVDTRDRTDFTRSGVRLDLRLEAASEIGGGRELVQSWGDLEVHVPLNEDWTARARATTGSTAGDAPPVHRSFFLGGAVPDRVAPRRRLTLPGLTPQALRGSTVQRMAAGLRVLVGSNLHLGVGWTGGDVRPDWALRLSDWSHGFSASAGVQTPLGPVRLIVGGATGSPGPRVAIDAGGQF